MAHVIWNGVGLEAPGPWEPSAVERDGLVLALDERPVCELKWNRVRGSFSFDKHLRRLRKGTRRAQVVKLAFDQTPEPWQAGLDSLARSGFRNASFSWEAPGEQGLGAVLHNPGTGLACMVQFFLSPNLDGEGAARVLATLRDHTGGKSVPWRMFGLAGRVPAGYVLETFSFKPGHYQVVYWLPRSGRNPLPPGKGPGTRLTFDRFAPASVLLRGTGLADWVEQNVEHASDLEAEDDAAVWNRDDRSVLRRVFRRRRLCRGRAWTTNPGNAILSVSARGREPVATSEFQRICENYALVQEEG